MVGCVAAFAVSYALGRYKRSVWTTAILPVLWIGGAIALEVTTGAIFSPQTWFAVIGDAATSSVL